MAQQGLFTQGPSVSDLLQQRNQRSTDLQQTLMANAAAGARDPMKAQAASLIGSSLGRALAGSMGGGQDKQVEALEASNAQQQGLQQEALAVSSGTIAEKRAFINKIAPIYPEYAQDLTDKVNLQAAAEAKTLADKTAKDAALQLTADKYAKDQARMDAALGLTAQNKLEDDLDANVKLEQERMKKEQEKQVAQTSAIAALGPNPPAALVKSINDGSTKAITAAWAIAANQHKDGDEARRVADIYGVGYEVGTKKNKEELRKRFEKAGSTTVKVVINKDENNNQPLTQSMRSQMQKNLISSKANLVRINGVAEAFDESHFTTWGSIKGKIGGMLDRSGIVDKGTPVVGELVEYSADQQVAFTQIDQLFNAYRSEITGAAAAVAELDRLKKAYMNTDRGPEATRRVLANFQKTAENGIVELENIVEFGVPLPANLNVRNWADPTTFTEAQLDEAYNAAIAAEG